MAQSLARLWTHLIFSTKERYPFLSEPNVRADMHGYLATLLRTHDCPTLVVGGCADHVHALFSLSKKLFNFKYRQGSKANIFILDQDGGATLFKIPLAGRLRCVLGKSIACSTSS
jgi:REP element-mobilizing transposase RayT